MFPEKRTRIKTTFYEAPVLPIANEKKFKCGQIRYRPEWKSIDRNLGVRWDANLIVNFIAFQLLDKVFFGLVSFQLGDVYHLPLSY